MKKPPFRVMLGYGVWAASILIGIVVTWFLVYIWLDTDLERFQFKYFVLTIISVASITVIWLDYFLDTKILPD
jgi:hypothetical protein